MVYTWEKIHSSRWSYYNGTDSAGAVNQVSLGVWSCTIYGGCWADRVNLAVVLPFEDAKALVETTVAMRGD